jgi:subtilisin family serine protease
VKAGRPFLPPPLPGPRAIQALGASRDLLVQANDSRADAPLQFLGGQRVSRTLDIWRIGSFALVPALPALERAGLVRAVEPDRVRHADARLDFGDPLVPTEWWRAAVGADAVTPPGPGKPVTVIDSGLDLTHPEFVNRPDTTVLNTQTTTGSDGEGHGTAVSSVAAAPADGEGVVGVYPQAVLRSWDASPSETSGISISDEVGGLDAATSNARGVINLSLGGTSYSFQEEEAIEAAFGQGSLIVASAGNEFQQNNPTEYPASFNHVLTIAATNEQNSPTDFSNENLAVDLAAPGQDIPVAVPLDVNPSGFDSWDGTSFSAPIVSGAAAWVWTVRPSLAVTQLFDLMRFSAKDIFNKGYDTSTGFGLLDIAAALHWTAPTVDPQEPNEDVYLVKPGGLFKDGSALLTSPARHRATLKARLDVTEDPEDVYRVWLPAHSTISISIPKTDANVQLEAWDTRTASVHERGAAAKRDLLAVSANPGTRPDAVRVENLAAKGAVIYADVFLAKGVDQAAYTLTIAPAPKR